MSTRRKGIRAPSALKSAERKLASGLQEIANATAGIYKDELKAGGALLDGRVAMDADLDRAKIERAIARAASIIPRRFTSPALRALMARYYDQNDKRAKAALYAEVERLLGIPTAKLLLNDTSAAVRERLLDENLRYVEQLRDDILGGFSQRAVEAIDSGEGIEAALDAISKLPETYRGRIRTNARTQIQSYNSIMANSRARAVGVDEAEWVTSMDGRERPSHAERNGKRFKLTEGLYSNEDGLTLLPGTDYNCRCSQLFVVPDPSKIRG